MPNEHVAPYLLDPFAFPSETKGRFAMLAMAALACGANLGFVLYAVLVGDRRAMEAMGRLEPVIQQWWGKTIFNLDIPNLKVIAQQEAIVSRASLSVLAERLILPCLTLILLIALATAFYRRCPERVRLRHRSRPLTRFESPVVVADLENCAERFDLNLPQLEYSSGLAQGHAFGVKGKDVLLLHGTPAVLEKSWGEANRVIALHELAHIANADSHEREKAKSLWKALFIVLVGGVVLLRTGGIRLNAIGLFQIAAMLLFVRALWAGLIRTRELYADWRVASWGEGAALASVLTLPEGEREPWRRWSWWWAAWERWGDRPWWGPIWRLFYGILQCTRWLLWLHPSFRARREVLADSRRLFKISMDLPFFTGILLSLVISESLILALVFIAIIMASIGLLQSLLLPFLADLQSVVARNLLFVGFMVAAQFLLLATITIFILFVAYFATRTIGVQLQRNAVAEMVCGSGSAWGYARLLPAAFLLAVGIEAGFHLAPFNLLAFTSRERWVATPLWVASFTILLWLWLSYAHGLSRMLLGSYVGRVSPKLRQAIVTWSSVTLLTVLLWPAVLARLTLQALPLMHDQGRILNRIEFRKIFIYGLFDTTLVFLILALVVYFIWALASMVLLRLGPLRRRKRCPSCREEAHYMLSLGRKCKSCGGSLAPWILVPTGGRV